MVVAILTPNRKAMVATPTAWFGGCVDENRDNHEEPGDGSTDLVPQKSTI